MQDGQDICVKRVMIYLCISKLDFVFLITEHPGSFYLKFLKYKENVSLTKLQTITAPCSQKSVFFGTAMAKLDTVYKRLIKDTL